MPEGDPRPNIPEWAANERKRDLAWIRENLQAFWFMAQAGYTMVGRGALMVDSTTRELDDSNYVLYFDQEQVINGGEPDSIRMVAEYDPDWEFVTVLLKRFNRMSTYRVSIPRLRPQRDSD